MNYFIMFDFKQVINHCLIILTEPKQPAYVRENRILGQLKLTLHYERGAFMVSNLFYYDTFSIILKVLKCFCSSATYLTITITILILIFHPYSLKIFYSNPNNMMISFH